MPLLHVSVRPVSTELQCETQTRDVQQTAGPQLRVRARNTGLPFPRITALSTGDGQSGGRAPTRRKTRRTGGEKLALARRHLHEFPDLQAGELTPQVSTTTGLTESSACG